VGGRNLPIPIDLAIGSAKHLTMFTGVFTLSVNEPEVLLLGLSGYLKRNLLSRSIVVLKPKSQNIKTFI